MNDSNQLLTDDFIRIAYESHGEDIKKWPCELKDQAVRMCFRRAGTNQMRDIMCDFWANNRDEDDEEKDGIAILYNVRSIRQGSDVIYVGDVNGALEKFKNCIYSPLEHFMQIDIDDWVQANVTPRLQGYK